MLTRYQPRILSLFVLAGLDCLIAKPAGQAAELIALDDVARGAYQLEPCSNTGIATAHAVIERFAGL
jgi:hypothetical protein